MQRVNTNLYLRNGNYYCRVFVPVELQDKLGKREIWKSLSTSNLHKAKLKLNLVIGTLLTGRAMTKQEKIELNKGNIELIAERYINHQEFAFAKAYNDCLRDQHPESEGDLEVLKDNIEDFWHDFTLYDRKPAIKMYLNKEGISYDEFYEEKLLSLVEEISLGFTKRL